MFILGFLLLFFLGCFMFFISNVVLGIFYALQLFFMFVMNILIFCLELFFVVVGYLIEMIEILYKRFLKSK